MTKSEYMRDWRARNKERIADYARAYRLEHIAERTAYARQWDAEHPGYFRQKAKEWAATHPERVKLRNRKWKLNPDNKSRIALYASRNYRKHTALRKEVCYRYYRMRCATDPIYRMVRSFRTRIQTRIKKPHRSPMWELLGCAAHELRAHLSSLFKAGMSWDNYGFGDGKWVVDHIRPIASFDMRIAEDQRKCWHYSNLQPLWFVENGVKHAKITR